MLAREALGSARASRVVSGASPETILRVTHLSLRSRTVRCLGPSRTGTSLDMTKKSAGDSGGQCVSSKGCALTERRLQLHKPSVMRLLGSAMEFAFPKRKTA